MAVAAPDREPGDEMMKHEVVQHDESRGAAQRLDDPAVRLGVVADVVDAEVGPARRLLRAARDDDDVAPLPQRGQQERASSPRCPSAPAASG